MSDEPPEEVVVGTNPQRFEFEVIVWLGDKWGKSGEVPEDEHSYFGK